MNLKYVFISLFFYLHNQIIFCTAESVMYISTERPSVDWIDTKTFKNFTLLSKRLSRQDPRHYVSIYAHSLVILGNNLKADFFFYQFLTNRYQPSFVEMHFGFCDMLHLDTIFGQSLRIALMGVQCPLPPGIYDMRNMTIPFVPSGFPFTKGRIYCNLSLVENGKAKQVGRGSIDMELKMRKIKKN